MCCENRWPNEQGKVVEKVVKRLRGVDFYQVIENARKINFKKCPKGGLRYDIMFL